MNVITLSLDHYDMDPVFDQVLFVTNAAFTIVFVVEVLVKLPGFGFKEYAGDPFNVFDFIIVAVSLVELAMSGGGGGGSGLDGGLTMIRAFRLLRVFKLVRLHESMNQLLSAVILSMSDLFYFLVLSFIFTTIFAIFGFQLFRGKFTVGDYTPRLNFDTMGDAYTTVFVIISGILNMPQAQHSIA